MSDSKSDEAKINTAISFSRKKGRKNWIDLANIGKFLDLKESAFLTKYHNPRNPTTEMITMSNSPTKEK